MFIACFWCMHVSLCYCYIVFMKNHKVQYKCWPCCCCCCWLLFSSVFTVWKQLWSLWYFFLFFISCTSLTYVGMPIISTAKLHLVCLFLVFPSVVIWRRRKKRKKKKRKGAKCRSWRLEKVCVKQNHYDIFCTVAKVNINTCSIKRIYHFKYLLLFL